MSSRIIFEDNDTDTSFEVVGDTITETYQKFWLLFDGVTSMCKEEFFKDAEEVTPNNTKEQTEKSHSKIEEAQVINFKDATDSAEESKEEVSNGLDENPSITLEDLKDADRRSTILSVFFDKGITDFEVILDYCTKFRPDNPILKMFKDEGTMARNMKSTYKKMMAASKA